MQSFGLHVRSTSSCVRAGVWEPVRSRAATRNNHEIVKCYKCRTNEHPSLSSFLTSLFSNQNSVFWHLSSQSKSTIIDLIVARNVALFCENQIFKFWDKTLYPIRAISCTADSEWKVRINEGIIRRRRISMLNSRSPKKSWNFYETHSNCYLKINMRMISDKFWYSIYGINASPWLNVKNLNYIKYLNRNNLFVINFNFGKFDQQVTQPLKRLSKFIGFYANWYGRPNPEGQIKENRKAK